MTAFLLLGALVVVLAGTGIVLQQLRARARANEVVRGVASAAPPSWAGSHTPEARLHRRLRDAVRGLDRLQRLDESVRTAIESEALAIDERLVAVAALPESVRQEPFAALTRAVGRLEDAVAALVVPEGSSDPLTGATEYRELLMEARAELDRLDGTDDTDGTPMPGT